MADAYTVTQVTAYIKNMFSRDFALGRITVTGEVSNCKYHSSGHIYFTLKDSGAQLSCVMFARDRGGLSFRLSDGQKIDASGQITVYEKSGSYQLYVKGCRLSGSGELYEKYLKLKAELSEMGMFDDIYKKPIPPYAIKIGIVTASTGAAIQDIINISRRRNPYVSLTLCPARVQGEGAAQSIVRGLRRLDRMGLDVIIVGRGGGSIEDLWAFNEEAVARAIFEAETPVISAVGHETDFTIADFVSDMRAPTPSAAAELAVFSFDEFEEEINAASDRLKVLLRHKSRMADERLKGYTERLKRLSPQNVLREKRALLGGVRSQMSSAAEKKLLQAGYRLQGFGSGIKNAMDGKLDESTERLKLMSAKLDAMSPLKKISGGYGYIMTDNGKALKTVKDVNTGDRLSVFIRDGRVETGVLSVGEFKYD